MTWQQNPIELVAFAGLYLSGFALIKYARRGCKPMKLRNIKLVYNAIMSFFSLYIFWGVAVVLAKNVDDSGARDVFVCDDKQKGYNGLEWYFQLFYHSKFVEFADTFFLVMAGSAEPSLKMGLHLYHHFITPSIVYTTWFYPCTGGWVGPLTNSIVHVIMYAYYGLSVIFPCIKKYGNLVTYVQLTQFMSVMIYHIVLVIPNNTFACNCNMAQLYFNFSQYIIFFMLFMFFLTKTPR
eukprot:sb/3469191/